MSRYQTRSDSCKKRQRREKLTFRFGIRRVTATAKWTSCETSGCSVPTRNKFWRAVRRALTRCQNKTTCRLKKKKTISRHRRRRACSWQICCLWAIDILRLGRKDCGTQADHTDAHQPLEVKMQDDSHRLQSAQDRLSLNRQQLQAAKANATDMWETTAS